MKKNLYDIFANAWLEDCDSIWIYSDPHFGDLDSYKFRHVFNIEIRDGKTYYQTGNGIWEDEESLKCSMNEFDEMQIKNINTKAGKNACLIILGDIGDIECVKKLKAKRKILILGNHDKGASNYKRVIKPSEKKIDEIIGDDEVDEKQRDFIRAYVTGGMLMGIHSYMDDNHLFDEVYEGPLMINDRLILSHEPIDVLDYMFNIHGHCHNLPYVYDAKHRNVCAEALEYTPISLTRLLKLGVLKNTKSIHRDYIDNRLETLAKEGSD